MTKLNTLFWQKLSIAFIVAFLGSLVTTITGWGDSPNFQFDRAALISLLVGAIGAGARAVLALSPVNLVPSDKQHSLTRRTIGAQHGQVNVLLLVVIVVVLIALVGGFAVSPWLFILLLVVLLLLFA